MERKIFNTALILLFACCAVSNLKAACIYEQVLRSEILPIGVLLSWSTASESNNSMFIIEKSEDGFEFKESGTIKGSGTIRHAKKYSFLDPHPTPRKTFYRLKQVDFDGTSSYSDVIKIEQAEESKFAMAQIKNEYVTNTFEFTLDAFTNIGAVLRVIDGAGTIVWQGSQQLMKGLNNLTVDMSSHQDGIYKVTVAVAYDEIEMTIRKASKPETNMAADKKTVKKN